MNEVQGQIAAAKQQVTSHPGCGCDDCREARMVLRRFAVDLNEDGEAEESE